MIPRYVSSDIEIAHKSGSSGRIKGDAGIVLLPTGPLVIAAFAVDASDGRRAQDAISEISRVAVRALSSEDAL